MTMSGSFWSLSRFAASWAPGAEPTPPNSHRTKVVFTEQHIETIGGSDTTAPIDVEPSSVALIGKSKLPVELIVHIVLLTAHDIVLDAGQDVAAKLLQLGRVSRPCHRAILATLILPDLTLYGANQLCAFAIALEKDRLGIRGLAATRIRNLTVRAQSWRSAATPPALFDASQAQTRFDKQLLPWIRLVLPHCRTLHTLRIEGVPRGLLARSAKVGLDKLSPKLTSFSCLVGHYGADLERDFWAAQRWTNLSQLQLHGPRFSLTTSVALSLASLPQLRKLGLVVPMIMPPTSDLMPAADDGGLIRVGSVSVLQTLMDHSSTLELILLVGHGERDYVGYSERLRGWMQELRRDRARRKLELKLVSVMRRTSSWQDGDRSRTRVHPCEVSTWMMERAQKGLEWFEDEHQDRDDAARLKPELDHWMESWEPPEYATSMGSNAVSNTPSRSMSRTGSNARTAEAHMHQMDATDMLSSDAEDDDATSSA